MISIKIKLWIARIFQYLLYFFVPIKHNRIMFYANNRKGYVCNPTYIMRYILQKYPNEYELIWVSAWPESCEQIENVQVVGRRSFNYYRSFIRTKFFITNDMIDENLIKKSGQIFISTWHGGGAYKKVGIDTINEDKQFANNFSKWYHRLDYFISSCQKCTEIYSQAFGLKKEQFLEIGTPRNDIFFGNHYEIRQKVRKAFHITPKTKILLFAPSFQLTEHTPYSPQIKHWKLLLQQLETITKCPWKIIYRTHYFCEAENGLMNAMLDGNSYYDMQELLYASDILVTDYSSCMWDFALTGKPAFLLKYRIDEYEKNDRGFFIPPQKWPYIFVKQIEDISYIYKDLKHEDILQKYQQHFDYMGSFENGTACSNFIKFLKKH